jgi:hypothetical protein
MFSMMDPSCAHRAVCVAVKQRRARLPENAKTARPNRTLVSCLGRDSRTASNAQQRVCMPCVLCERVYACALLEMSLFTGNSIGTNGHHAALVAHSSHTLREHTSRSRMQLRGWIPAQTSLGLEVLHGTERRLRHAAARLS